MLGGLETRRESAADIAVVIDDENVSQAIPRLAAQFAFYRSTGRQHQEATLLVILQIARLYLPTPLRYALRAF